MKIGYFVPIYKYIEKTPTSPIRNKIEITDAIDSVAKEGRDYGEFIDGLNMNVNSYDDLLKVSILVSKTML